MFQSTVWQCRTTMSDPISCYGSEQILTSLSDRALCLIRIVHARCLSDTIHFPMVTLKICLSYNSVYIVNRGPLRTHEKRTVRCHFLWLWPNYVWQRGEQSLARSRCLSCGLNCLYLFPPTQRTKGGNSARLTSREYQRDRTTKT